MSRLVVHGEVFEHAARIIRHPSVAAGSSNARRCCLQLLATCASSNETGPHVEALVSVGMHLTDIMESSEDAQLVEAASSALAELSAVNASGADKVCSSIGVPIKLVRLLERNISNNGLCLHLWRAISNYCVAAVTSAVAADRFDFLVVQRTGILELLASQLSEYINLHFDEALSTVSTVRCTVHSLALLGNLLAQVHPLYAISLLWLTQRTGAFI